METMEVAVLSWKLIGQNLLYTFSGLLLMFLGLVLFDIVTPYKIFDEVRGGNKAVAWAAAGFLISTGIVLGAAFRSHLLWMNAMAMATIGVVLNILGYYTWELMTPRWSLNRAIKGGTETAGIVCCGIFVALGLIVAGSF